MMLMLVYVLVMLFSSDLTRTTEAFTTTSSTTPTCIRSRYSQSSISRRMDDAAEQLHVGSSRQSPTRLQQLVHQKSDMGSNKKKECHMPCENLIDDNEDESRREALFSMVGALWAITGTSITIVSTSSSDPAHAASGDFAKIELPNPYQALSDRATKQCLSESLGNRECLVYADDADKFLYKGLNGNALLQRLQTSTEALEKIPSLIESKKWSQVTGVLSGPMGELLRTMNQVVEMSSKAGDSSDAASAALATTLRGKLNDVKKDIYAMQAAVDKRQVDAALKYHAQSTLHLNEFIRAAL